MKIKNIPFFYLFLLISILLPLISSAQGIVPCNGLECRFCHLFQLVKNIIDWLVRISFTLAIIFIVWGGFKIIFAGANPGLVSSGRQTIIRAVVGLVILLCAWLIVDTVLKVLTGGAWGPWNTINCV